MSDLILPGGQPPKGRLQILVPRGHEDGDGPSMICRVPTGNGEVCGKLFYSGEERAWQRHVGVCARRHAAEIHAESPRTKMPLFTPEAWDPELSKYMKRLGERMLREGRLVVKKNERAGF